MSLRKLKAWEDAGLLDAATAARISDWEARHTFARFSNRNCAFFLLAGLLFGIEIESCARCGAQRVALDDLGAGEDEGFEGHLVQPGRVDRLIQGPWLFVQRVGATLASSRPRPQGRLKVLFAPAFDHCIR
jgi:hypothetical protein